MAENNVPLRKSKKEKKLKTLPLLARPLLKNPENFIFEDPIESEKDLEKIKVAPIDPKALDPMTLNAAMDIGKKLINRCILHFILPCLVSPF